jgi:hypothetical protein
MTASGRFLGARGGLRVPADIGQEDLRELRELPFPDPADVRESVPGGRAVSGEIPQ